MFKHRVLSNQLGAFVGKTGRRGKAAFLDGYAGPGVYDDGAPGSPDIARSVADDVRAIRDFDAVFIESKRRYADRLRDHLDEQGYSHWKVLHGTCQDQLPIALAWLKDLPLLAFLDPYGLAISFDQLIDDVLGRSRQQGSRLPTEVILNFSDLALQRLGGFLDKDYQVGQQGLFEELVDLETAGMTEEQRIATRERKQQQALSLMDDFLGDQWWRDVYRRAGQSAPDVIRAQWLERVRSRMGGNWRTLDVPVSDSVDGPARYHLILITEHPDGEWEFMDGVSRAWEKMYRESWAPPPLDTLFGETQSEPPSLDDELITGLSEHLREVARRGKPVPVQSNLAKVFGPTLGQARAKHLRAAVLLLQAVGILAGEAPTFKRLSSYIIRPA